MADVAGEAGSEGRYTLAHYDTGKYMRLDSAALRALNVVPTRADGAGADSFSLYKLLNRGRTARPAPAPALAWGVRPPWLARGPVRRGGTRRRRRRWGSGCCCGGCTSR